MRTLLIASCSNALFPHGGTIWEALESVALLRRCVTGVGFEVSKPHALGLRRDFRVLNSVETVKDNGYF